MNRNIREFSFEVFPIVVKDIIKYFLFFVLMNKVLMTLDLYM